MRHPKANEEARQGFQEKIAGYQKQGKSLVYLDESGFAHDMPRLYGYATRGQRCFGTHDWQAKGRTNVIGALLGATLIAVGLFNCSINSDVFYAWVTQELLPALPHPCVMMMDNASFHKRKDIQHAILNAGHSIEYLPPYSPEFNPIEHTWAQAKRKRRELQCDINTLFSEHIM
ncbi:IS630 family transposase [Candidatus Hamiltonella defensa]|uniref:IS630 family transposase n=1 Tax=Candidatus Williamhamiltonella defendens TaxID=138072 RepID=UPI002A4E2756|nr:IS630 family transposase [Candidatus Hamiltonella defensa]